MALPRIGAVPPLLVAALALGILALGPLGLRLGWWAYGFGLYRLMPASGLLAAIAVVLSILALVREWSRLRLGGRAMLFVALILGASLVYVPVFYWQTRKSVPPIHDITTDLDNPPAFSAVLPARAAERAGSLDRRTPQLAELQKAAYPDLAPLTTTLSPSRAFAEALEAAKSMPGWTVVAADPTAGRIEASERTRWFRFTDDVVIRVVGDGAGSRIDVRSTSRQGRSDYGVNAARIRAYMGALRKRIG
jgi:uncharacterized protein (DUF1499 family)